MLKLALQQFLYTVLLILFIGILGNRILNRIDNNCNAVKDYYKVYYEYNLNHHQSIPDYNGNTEWSIDTVAIDTIYVRL